MALVALEGGWLGRSTDVWPHFQAWTPLLRVTWKDAAPADDKVCNCFSSGRHKLHYRSFWFACITQNKTFFSRVQCFAVSSFHMLKATLWWCFMEASYNTYQNQVFNCMILERELPYFLGYFDKNVQECRVFWGDFGGRSRFKAVSVIQRGWGSIANTSLTLQ